MSIKILPSIMCCGVEEYVPYLEVFEKVKVDGIHFDVMDGKYVKNVMLGTNIYSDVRRLSNLPIDVHIMAWEPENIISYYKIHSGDRICFHPETTAHPYRLLQEIRRMGVAAGLVLNPGTPLGYLEECIDVVDYVVIMAVNPGFEGQRMVPGTLNKIRRTRKLLIKYKKEQIDLEIDGNTSFENVCLMRKAGANSFVAGTSSIMTNHELFEKQYRSYREILEKTRSEEE